MTFERPLPPRNPGSACGRVFTPECKYSVRSRRPIAFCYDWAFERDVPPHTLSQKSQLVHLLIGPILGALTRFQFHCSQVYIDKNNQKLQAGPEASCCQQVADTDSSSTSLYVRSPLWSR